MDVITALRGFLASPEARESIRVCYDIPTLEEVSIAPEKRLEEARRRWTGTDIDSVRTEADRSCDMLPRLCDA